MRNIRIGDKLLCKKGCDFGLYLSIDYGKWYKVKNIKHRSYTSLFINIYVKDTFTELFIISELKNDTSHLPNINDYFYSKDEMRKFKLERLQCIE